MTKIPFNLISSKKIEIKFKVRSKKVKFWNFAKKLYVSDAEWAQESNGAISVSVGQIELPEISFCIWRHNLAIGML